MTQNSKVAVVTGGAQGIGKAIVKAFLEKGWATVVADSDREAGEETSRELASLGTVVFIETDVSIEEQVEHLFQQTMRHFGRIDALINNAGISHNKALEYLTLEEWNRVLGVNLTGTFLCAKHASPHLKNTGGSIISIASTRAFMSEACTEAYSASKGDDHTVGSGAGGTANDCAEVVRVLDAVQHDDQPILPRVAAAVKNCIKFRVGKTFDPEGNSLMVVVAAKP